MQIRKTKAILNLVEGTPEFRHVVYSLNRYTAFGGTAALPFGTDRIAVAYGALPKGIFWDGRLRVLADWIVADLKSKGIVPHLVEGHKITVEGLVAQQVAKAFSCPFICDIQGNTDCLVLKNKPNYYKIFRSVVADAALILPYAPWSIKPFQDKVGLSPLKCTVLPVIPDIDSLSAAPVLSSSRLITIFNLDFWKMKNMAGLLEAADRLSSKYPRIHIDIFGQGEAKSIVVANGIIEKFGGSKRATIMGPVRNEDLPSIMKKYDAFVMPTLRETYGLVYIESLFAGIPVLYSKGRSIDGYFKPTKIGYACVPESVKDITQGIDYLLTNEAILKTSIAQMQERGDFDRLRRGGILELYHTELTRVLKKREKII